MSSACRICSAAVLKGTGCDGSGVGWHGHIRTGGGTGGAGGADTETLTLYRQIDNQTTWEYYIIDRQTTLGYFILEFVCTSMHVWKHGSSI